MAYQFVADLENFLRGKYEKFPAGTVIVPEACPPGMAGDLTVNCFRFAKSCGNPMAVAAETAAFLKQHADVEQAEAVKAFVNVTLKPGALHRD